MPGAMPGAMSGVPGAVPGAIPPGALPGALGPSPTPCFEARRHAGSSQFFHLCLVCVCGCVCVEGGPVTKALYFVELLRVAFGGPRPFQAPQQPMMPRQAPSAACCFAPCILGLCFPAHCGLAGGSRARQKGHSKWSSLQPSVLINLQFFTRLVAMCKMKQTSFCGLRNGRPGHKSVEKQRHHQQGCPSCQVEVLLPLDLADFRPFTESYGQEPPWNDVTTVMMRNLPNKPGAYTFGV